MRKRFQFALFVFLSVLFLPSMAFADGQRTGACPTSNLGGGVTCVQYGLYDSYPGTAQTSVALNFTPKDHTNGFVVGAYFCFDTKCSAYSQPQRATLSNNVNTGEEPCFAPSPHSPFNTVPTGAYPATGIQPLYLWYCPTLPAGVTKVTMNCTATGGCSYMSFWIVELTGMCKTEPCWDVDGYEQGASGANGVTLSTPATNYKDELIVTLFQNIHDETYSASSPTVAFQDSQSLSLYPGNMLAGMMSTNAGVAYSLTATWTGAGDLGYGTIGAIKTLQSVSQAAGPPAAPTALTATVQ